MSFYEVIYETGASSVISGDSDDEVLSGLSEQHRRASTGEEAGPGGGPAERIKRVLKYERHPNDFCVDSTLAADEVKALVTAYLKGKDVVDVNELSLELASAVHPMVSSEVFESNFKMEETGEITADKWEEASA